MVLTFYDSLFLFKIYNNLLFYDYRYYCDFEIVSNILIPYTDISIDNGGVRIWYPCPNTDTLCYNTDTLYALNKLYIIDESIRQITITLFIINFMNNLF